jgi:hypothetical protein
MQNTNNAASHSPALFSVLTLVPSLILTIFWTTCFQKLHMYFLYLKREFKCQRPRERKIKLSRPPKALFFLKIVILPPQLYTVLCKTEPFYRTKKIFFLWLSCVQLHSVSVGWTLRCVFIWRYDLQIRCYSMTPTKVSSKRDQEINIRKRHENTI